MRQSNWLRSFILLAGLAALLSQPLWPQRRRNDPFGTRRTLGNFPQIIVPDRRSTVTRRMIKASHQKLQEEVAQLAEMSAALQEDISNSNEDELPLDALKKAEEIEKLAKKVQGRIKNL